MNYSPLPLSGHQSAFNPTHRMDIYLSEESSIVTVYHRPALCHMSHTVKCCYTVIYCHTLSSVVTQCHTLNPCMCTMWCSVHLRWQYQFRAIALQHSFLLLRNWKVSLVRPFMALRSLWQLLYSKVAVTEHDTHFTYRITICHNYSSSLLAA